MGTLPSIDPVLGHVGAATLAVIFLLGGAAKLRDLALFRAVLDDYRLLPGLALAPVALLLPLAEVAAGVALLLPGQRELAAVLALALLALVSAAVAINIARGRRHISCGCGGGDHVPLSGGVLLRNGVLALLAVLATWPVSARETVWLDPLAAALATLFLLGLYLVANQMLRHHPRLLALKDAP